MRSIILTIYFVLITSLAMAETYTGRAESLESNSRGVKFVIVVKDSKNVEVLRRGQWVSTGVMTALEVEVAIKNVVDRMTQEMYAHLEGIKEVLKKKAELEAYNYSCDVFVEPKDRPSPQTPRL